MNQLGIQEEIGRLQKELRIGGVETEQRILDLRAEVDRIRIEVEAIKTFLCIANPAFREQFPQILARTIEEVNPEFD